jgi:hypothetical protein
MSQSKNEQNPAGPRYFKATDLAGFCGVDLKTIHNWADQAKIDFFRTPGRHLRFRPGEVLRFLEKYGYDLPEVVKQAAAASGPGESSATPVAPAGEA